MHYPERLVRLAALTALLSIAACVDSVSAPRIQDDASASRAGGGGGGGGVYTMTNAASGNAIVAFRRAADG